MQNQQQTQFNQISSLEYKESSNNNKEQYQEISTTYSPILPRSYSNDQNQQIFFNKEAKSPEILFNDQGKPISTLDYIKSQKDIENLDFINTLIRLKSNSNNYDTYSPSNERPTQESYHHIKDNQQQVPTSSSEKETNIAIGNIDDSKISLKERIDIYDEYDNKSMNSNKKTTAKELKRNDLIEITNKRKQMMDSPQEIDKINIQLDSKGIVTKEIIENSPSFSIQRQQQSMKINSNSKQQENNIINENNKSNSNKKSQNIAGANDKKNLNKLNRPNEVNNKQFNNRKNNRLMEDILRETKEIEAGIIKKQEKRNASNSNIINTNSDTMKINHLHEKTINSIKPNHIINKPKVKEKQQTIPPNEEHHTQIIKDQSNKINPKLLEFKPKHNKSASFHNDNHNNNINQTKIEYANELPLSSLIIKSNNKEQHIPQSESIESTEMLSLNNKYTSNILKESINNPHTNCIEPKRQTEAKEEIPMINKAEIDLFDDNTIDNNINHIKTTSKMNNTNDKPKNKILINLIQPIKENQIEFDIDELLHPKYLFKSANDSINYINKTNSNKKSNLIDTKSKDNKNITQLNKTNTAKNLPAYNKSHINNSSSSNLGKNVSTPSKSIQITSKTPTNNKYKFEPKKSKELMFTEGKISLQKPFSHRMMKDLSKSSSNSKKIISITNLTSTNEKSKNDNNFNQIDSLLHLTENAMNNHNHIVKNLNKNNHINGNKKNTFQSKSQTKLHS